MKSAVKMFAVLVMILGLAVFSPVMLLAAEHAGAEHGGAVMEEVEEEEVLTPVEETVSTITDADKATVKEAADALRATNPELAEKLDKIAR